MDGRRGKGQTELEENTLLDVVYLYTENAESDVKQHFKRQGHFWCHRNIYQVDRNHKGIMSKALDGNVKYVALP